MKIKGGETSSLQEEFVNRKVYKEKLTSKYAAYFIDTWYQYPNYGCFNEKFETVAVVPSENSENLSAFGSYAPASHRVLPFVAKAYDKFRQKFMARADSPNFNVPSHFQNLIPTKGYENFDELYSNYILNLKDNMIYNNPRSSYQKERKLETILANIKTFPITQSGFLLSRHCPISVTGLAVEIANLSHVYDSIKADIMRNHTFTCFLEDAKAFGFLVDKNNPWRLIANLNSAPMKKLILEYKEDTRPEYVMARFFHRKTHFEDFANVYSFFEKDLTIQELFSYTVDIRMAETNMPHDTKLRNKIIKEISEIYTVYSGNYPANPFKGSSAILGEYCSARLREIYRSKARINSYQPTTLRDYF